MHILDNVHCDQQPHNLPAMFGEVPIDEVRSPKRDLGTSSVPPL